MAKARRGRAPLPRTRNTVFADNSKLRDEKAFKAKFEIISDAFYCARTLRHNEAANLARYLLGVFFNDKSDVQTSVSVDGEGYDYTVSVTIGEAVLELSQFKAEALKLAA